MRLICEEFRVLESTYRRFDENTWSKIEKGMDQNISDEQNKDLEIMYQNYKKNEQ